MKQQGYCCLKANISSYSTLLNSQPNATRTKTQAVVPQQSLNTHSMPAHGLWSNPNHILWVEWAIVHYISLTMLYVQIKASINKLSSWKVEMDTKSRTVDLQALNYQNMPLFFQHSIWVKHTTFIGQNLHWYFQTKYISIACLLHYWTCF